MTEAELLKAIVPAINGIDNGCAICIGNFVDEVNDILDKTDCQWRYTDDIPYDYMEKVKVITKKEHEERIQREDSF